MGTYPILRIRRRLELVGAEDSRILAGSRDPQYQRNLETGALKIR
jgi:hypothetical protein